SLEGRTMFAILARGRAQQPSEQPRRPAETPHEPTETGRGEISYQTRRAPAMACDRADAGSAPSVARHTTAGVAPDGVFPSGAPRGPLCHRPPLDADGADPDGHCLIDGACPRCEGH